MNIHHTNTTELRIHVAILAVMSVVLLTTIATVHGGEEHVVGTVTKVSDTAVTVKTTAGKTIEVGFDAKTTYQRAKHDPEDRHQSGRSNRDPRHGDKGEAGCPYRRDWGCTSSKASSQALRFGRE